MGKISKMEIKRFWKGFWQISDPKIWIASTVPLIVANALAFGHTGELSFYWLMITLIGIYSIEIAKNALNDVVDYQSGADLFVEKDKTTPFSGGKKVIVQKLLSIKETMAIFYLTLSIGIMTGLYITFYREFFVLWIGIAGILLAVFYSLPPVKLCYRGLGEVAIGITFGPLMVTGAYMVQASALSFDVILVSFPIGLIIASVIWINQYPDYEADYKAKKFNWVVRLGKRRGLIVYKALFIIAFLCFILMFIYFRNPLWLLPLVCIRLAIRAYKIAKENHEQIPEMLEANATTIKIYQIIGALMVLAAISEQY
ncbi:prenyltransferase [Natranaerofaba carboxydovora]|uniref:prenyltransferase n=1 Tax=Natranaerofaba carboxydovora TaxID=2742683 RepID=UPI001F134C3B|nr:prenyltransferase [Natranaerofaba carboxydovora]UMZ74054.1 1,4-dihydroxy-2-naphthoate octaprenyltransferase [Natranaerofaba carboxydovora]